MSRMPRTDRSTDPFKRGLRRLGLLIVTAQKRPKH